MSKPKRATWWKMLYHQRAAIESVPDEEVGKGLKAAFRYFDGEELDPADPRKHSQYSALCVHTLTNRSATMRNRLPMGGGELKIDGAVNKYSPPIASP